MKTKTLFAAMSFLTICSMAAQAQIPQQSIRWDKHSLIFDGKRVVPVMGEVHYSRIPQNEWREEVRKWAMCGQYLSSTSTPFRVSSLFTMLVPRCSTSRIPTVFILMMPGTPVWQRPSCSSSPPCLATSREGAADIEKCVISPLFYIEKCSFPQEVAYILGKFLRLLPML